MKSFVRKLEPMKNKKQAKPFEFVVLRCHMCNSQVTEDEYCYGCKVHICADCDAPLNERPFGYVHPPEMHAQAS